MSNTRTATEIFKFLVSRRKRSDFAKWTQEQGDPVSISTIIRADKENCRTPRQERAVELGNEYIRHLLGEVGPTTPVKETITAAAARRGGLVPEQV